MVISTPETVQDSINVFTTYLPNTDHDADQESEGGSQTTGETSVDDDWEDWEDCDFLSTDNDSADEWLP